MQILETIRKKHLARFLLFSPLPWFVNVGTDEYLTHSLQNKDKSEEFLISQFLVIRILHTSECFFCKYEHTQPFVQPSDSNSNINAQQ